MGVASCSTASVLITSVLTPMGVERCKGSDLMGAAADVSTDVLETPRSPSNLRNGTVTYRPDIPLKAKYDAWTRRREEGARSDAPQPPLTAVAAATLTAAASTKTRKRNRRRANAAKAAKNGEAVTHGNAQQSTPAAAASDEDKREEGWRMAELTGGAGGMSGDDQKDKAPSRKSLGRLGRRQRSESPGESGWRWAEVTGSSTGATCSPHQTSPSAQAAPAASDAGAEASECEQPLEGQQAESAVPELGDIVRLGAAAPPDCRGHLAVVTKVAEAHCTTVVLDSDGRYGVSECWPCFHDIVIERRSLRLGGRVVLDGLQSAKTKRLNGFTGRIIKHPREGHPTFIRKPSAPDKPQFTIVIGFDDPEAAGDKSVLLEPRFAVPYDDYIARMAQGLDQVLASSGLAQAATSQADNMHYAVGQRVCVRDEAEIHWKDGTVTSVDPLEVCVDGLEESFKWDLIKQAMESTEEEHPLS